MQTTGPNEGPRSPGAPSVNAGPDQFLEAATTVTLSGTVNDPSGNAAILWKVYSGPAGVVFANPNQASTNATINSPGTYTFLLSADDGVHAIAYDAVVIRVTGQNALANISTRVQVGTGNNIAIGGFIIVGNTSKQVVIRGLGPSLAAAGVPVPLNDPLLELYDSSGALLQGNDNWRTGGQETEIIQSGVVPTDDKESALIETLSGNAAYTAIVRGVNKTTGIAVVEVYALN